MDATEQCNCSVDAPMGKTCDRLLVPPEFEFASLLLTAWVPKLPRERLRFQLSVSVSV